MRLARAATEGQGLSGRLAAQGDPASRGRLPSSRDRDRLRPPEDAPGLGDGKTLRTAMLQIRRGPVILLRASPVL